MIFGIGLFLFLAPAFVLPNIPEDHWAAPPLYLMSFAGIVLVLGSIAGLAAGVWV